MRDRLFILLQHVLPKQRLTRLAGRVADARRGRTTTGLIRWFVDRYGVDMSEAAEPDIASYASFNEFFTRPLKPGIRPLADAAFVSPVDGAISRIGDIDEHRIIQAKGQGFTTKQLLGGDADLAEQFRHGHFANLYLSPRDYHRLHMPCAGRLERMIYVPGSLFSVNPVTARGVPGLFARNERTVCVFNSQAHGRFVMVLVGATIVGSMETVWHGVVNPERTGRIAQWDYSDRTIALEQGEEMGRFRLGSTVIMLFEKDRIALNPDWKPEGRVRLGEKMGESVS
ncbi:MAG: archaetidylserine decarboxylase [Erythrobacter sp.]|nr:archaetidylserine decarboxylase [Erythrobacter sp.]